MKLNLRPFMILTLAVTMAGTVAPAWAQQAGGVGPNYEMRMSALEDALRAMNGKVEQIEYAARTLGQNLQKLQADYDGRLSRLEQAQQAAVAAPAVAAPAPATASVEVNGSLGGIKTQGGTVTGAINNPKSPALPDVPADYGLTAQEQYDRAFGLLRQANYDEAEKAFKNFIDKNPKDKLIDNAKYWYGETLYVRGRFDQAAVAFADAYQQNAMGTKAPDSLLKLAMSLSALNKNPDACTTLLELKNKYPSASATVRSRAEEERNRMKCGAR